MPPIIPNRFLVRLCHPCPYVKDAPRDTDEDEHLVELPESARLNNFAALDEREKGKPSQIDFAATRPRRKAESDRDA